MTGRASRPSSFWRPRLDRHDTDRIGTRTIHDLGTDGEIDQRIARHGRQPIDARGFEEDARFLAKGFLVIGQLRDVDGDRSHLSAGDREIRRVFVETEWLAPSAFSRL